MPASPNARTIFTLSEEKKRSVRYDMVRHGDEPVVATSIYVSKSVLTKPWPLKIELSLSEIP